MYAVDSLCILSSERGCGGHSIATMSCNDLLVGFEPAVRSALAFKLDTSFLDKFFVTYAPPELSEPATTKILFIASPVS